MPPSGIRTRNPTKQTLVVDRKATAIGGTVGVFIPLMYPNRLRPHAVISDKPVSQNTDPCLLIGTLRQLT